MRNMKIKDIKSTYLVAQKELATILNVSRTDIILLETQDEDVNLTSSEIRSLENHRNKTIIKEDENQTQQKEIEIQKKAEIQKSEVQKTSYEEAMIHQVHTYIEHFPSECKVNIDTLHINPKKIIADRIKYLREENQIEVENLSKQLDISKARYTALEEGRGLLYPGMCNTLSDVFNVLPIVLNLRLVKLEQELAKKKSL